MALKVSFNRMIPSFIKFRAPRVDGMLPAMQTNTAVCIRTVSSQLLFRCVVHSNPAWLVWGHYRTYSACCSAHQPKLTINQFKTVKQQALGAYCRNIYTVQTKLVAFIYRTHTNAQSFPILGPCCKKGNTPVIPTRSYLDQIN